MLENKMKFAFTLSEVLITMALIGMVVAISTIILYTNYQEQALKSGVKKYHSVLKQSLEKYYIEQGERVIPIELERSQFYKDIKKYFNIIKDCGNEGCFYKTTKVQYKNYTDTFNLSDSYHYLFDDRQFILSDGALIMFENGRLGSTLIISVDVNGPEKAPNRLGKDLFMFQVDETGNLKAMGAEGTTYIGKSYCSNNSQNKLNGAGCTYKILTSK